MKTDKHVVQNTTAIYLFITRKRSTM